MMKWFKHYNNASKKKIINELENELGVHVGYALYFKFIEYCHSIWNVEKDPEFSISHKKLQNFLEISPKKYQSFVQILSKFHQIVNKKHSKLFHFTFPKLLEIMDRDQKYAREKRVQNALDIDTDKDQDNSNSKELLVETSKKVSTPGSQGRLIFGLYKKLFEGKLPMPRDYSKIYCRTCNARWREHPSIEFWNEYFQTVFDSPFLMGKINSDWTADLIWLLGPTNLEKVISGKYLKNSTASKSRWDVDVIKQEMENEQI